MQLIGLPRCFYRAARLTAPALSPEAKTRLQALEVWQRTGTREIAAEVFGLSQATLYRWRQRVDPQDLTSLEARSRRPRRLRQPTWPPALVEAVRQQREQYPRWGKDKLVVLLRRAGWAVSTSMVGRILTHLKARGLLVEPPRRAISATRRRPRPWAVRKPKDYVVARPGDLVELDTMDVRPLPGVILKHFTARDVISRWDVIEVYSRATATTAAAFLDALQQRLPFPLRALQVDGGGEFRAQFEALCQARGIRLFALPPKSPKLNGHVERAHWTHTEEFYEGYEGNFVLMSLRPALRTWEHTYNHVRPHQALRYLTPAEYLAHHAT